ncbi:MAG: hypothetical protein JW723_11705 [Bacteroidales bacterium]|nr:hypothetical protein [Bacteroidales bacterium]
MEATERQYFELLKTKIVGIMQKTYPGISKNIEDWKGNDIIEFQEDLKLRVNEYFSEKWFYTHYKTYQEKLPRIDLLNILSRYTGYVNWSDFKHKNRDQITIITEHKGSNRIFYILTAIALVIFIMAWIIIKTGSITTYRFCFVDKDSKEPVRNTKIEVAIIKDNESPILQLCDAEGCFAYKTGEQKIKFMVKAPYYFTDTITRILKKSKKTEEIPLKLNDYALMIYYYSNSKVNDWKKRRDQLDKVIADSAYICQVFNKGMMGMELYNKYEFINMLTTPARGLRNIEVLDMLYTDEKITTIRFIQNYTSR